MTKVTFVYFWEKVPSDRRFVQRTCREFEDEESAHEFAARLPPWCQPEIETSGYDR